jgi:hypothetical protein
MGTNLNLRAARRIAVLLTTTSGIIWVLFGRHVPPAMLGPPCPDWLQCPPGAVNEVSGFPQSYYDSKLWPSVAYPNRVIPYFRRGVVTPEDEDVTIFTSVTVDKAEILERLINHVQSSSVSVYTSPFHGVELTSTRFGVPSI